VDDETGVRSQGGGRHVELSHDRGGRKEIRVKG
jgi:hypothetical protein